MLSLSISKGKRQDDGIWEGLRAKLGCLHPPKSKESFDDLTFVSRSEKIQEEKVLLIIEEAIAEGRSLDLEYYSIGRDETSRRRVDPYLLLLHSGHWYLVGHCHLRKEIGMFRMARIKQIKPGKENSYIIPEDLDPQVFLRRKPWELPVHQPYIVEQKLCPETAWLVKQELGSRITLDEDGLVASFEVSNEPALMRWLYVNCDRVVVNRPPELAQKVSSILNSLAEEYCHGKI